MKHPNVLKIFDIVANDNDVLIYTEFCGSTI